MELYIYSQSLELQGVLDDFFSLRWRRKYVTCGEFELHCNVNSDTLSLLKSGYLVAKRDSVECGVIEGIFIEDNEENGETITVKGRFLSSYLERRITGDTVVIKDTAQNAMRYYVNQHCITPSDSDRKIPLLELGSLITDTEQIQVQATYKNLLSTCEKLARKSAQGFRIRPDFINKKLYFEVYKGVDRSINQTERPFVMLSEGYDNTKNTTYSFNDTGLKTYCLVCGTEENQAKINISVGGGVGLLRRETFTQASESKTSETTLSDYRAVLNQTGLDTLKQSTVTENFETEVEILEDYKTAWELGDIVSCNKKDWDITLTARITEIEEIFENGIIQVIPILGSPKPELIDLLKEE